MSAAPPSRPTRSSWTSHVGPISFLGGKANYDIDWETLDEDKAGVTRDSRGGWLGFTDKYWLTALAPANGAPIAASFRKSAGRRLPGRLCRRAGDRRSRARRSTSETRLFAGAKEKDCSTAMRRRGSPSFSKSIDWGWFEWFMRPIFSTC